MARAIKTRSSGRSPKTREKRESSRAAAKPAWKIRRARGLQILESPALDKLGWLTHGFSTRPGGASVIQKRPALNLGFTKWDEGKRVVANREKFVAALDAAEMPLTTMRQFHSDVIHVIATQCTDAPNGDALITNVSGLLLGVQTADCVPILLADTKRHAVAAIHAGWRGTLARIVVKTLGRMRMEYGTQTRDVVAALGPAIGQSCYEVGADVAQAFANQFPPAAEWFEGPFAQLADGVDPLWLPWLTMMPPGHVPPPPRVQLDLRAANRWQLLDAGVPERQIDENDLCTACSADLLFSYRREGENTGRMMAVIGIK
ncbi:MAG TPA: peptidoglycan editing factor PgeF [Candidatus Acidoferrales bacterium]|nr:peptidoglycan editing factor PgeF [Candidatus Acidoferrales bacterium]